MSDRARATVYGLASALLFGASAPISKRLLAETEPLMLSALLYLGAATALTLATLVRPATREAALRRTDVPALAGSVVSGGVVGPLLLLLGLARVSGFAGSLLLSLEGAFTAVIAVAVLHEHLAIGEVAGFALVLGGGAVLARGAGPSHADPAGALLIAGACMAWAVDNNLSERLSARDPVTTARAKTFFAGLASLALALALGVRQSLPSAGVVAVAVLVGAASYGASIALSVRAMRSLGAARQAALFATAPFVGAALAIPLLGERPGATALAAASGMTAGVILVVRSRHSHRHRHEPIEHDHLHFHDEHHRHRHDGPVNEPHSHPHRHEPIEHEHPHVSDLHHRHSHRDDGGER